MENLSSQDEPPHDVDEVSDEAFVARFWCHVVVAQVQKVNRLASLHDVHDLDDLHWQEINPTQFQDLDRLVCLEE